MGELRCCLPRPEAVPLRARLLASLLAARREDGELGDSLFEVRCASGGGGDVD